MKKLLSAILAVLLLTAVAGCSDNDGDVPDTSAVSGATTETVAFSATAENSAATTEQVQDEDSAISVYTENYMYGQCSVTLMYPIYGDSKHDAFDLSMRNHAVQMLLGKYGVMPEDSSVYETLSCDIKLETEHFISAVVTGQIINPTAAHDTHFAYTVNADSASGKIYLSEELVGDIELIKAGFEENKFEKIYGIDGLMDYVTVDVITGSWRSDYGIFPDMYFTEDTFGVVAELPHAVGGYAGFEIPYADAGDMINPVARGLAGIIVTTD